jgi:hypothetical protein
VLALQAAVGELQVHHVFKTFRFREHSRIFPKFQTQFIKRCVRKTEVDLLEATLTKYRGIVDKLVIAQGELKTEVGRLGTKVGRCKIDEGGGKKNGGGQT